MDNTLGKRIVQKRKQLAMTQEQLAEQLGVTAQAVSKWENDQSCPDITMLPRLAEIFGITTDELLGREAPEPVYVGTVQTPKDKEKRWEFHFDSGRKSALSFAVTVLAVGILYLISNLFSLPADFWEILWPTIPLVYGLMGIYPSFSFLRLGCAVTGLYFLLANMELLPFSIKGELLWPVIIILFGLYLLTKAMKKKNSPTVTFKGNHKKAQETLDTDEHSFEYSASFGENTQYVELSCLRSGSVSTSFGEYTIDLSGVQAVEDCSLELNSAFGQLTVLVPQRFAVRPHNSTFLAQIDIKGAPADTPEGVIRMNVSAAFGQIIIKYI